MKTPTGPSVYFLTILNLDWGCQLYVLSAFSLFQAFCFCSQKPARKANSCAWLKTLSDPVNGTASRDRSPGASGPDNSDQQRVISPTSRRWDASPSFLFFLTFFSWRINSVDSRAPHIGGLPWRQRPNSASQRCCPHAVQLIKYYAMMDGRGRQGLFYASDSSVFHELSGRVFPPARTFVCLLCVSVTSSVSDHSLHVIPPLSAEKKNGVLFFSVFLSDSHTIPVLLHPFIKTNDYTLGTAVMGLQQQLDSGFCRWHLLQSTWFHFTLPFFFFLFNLPADFFLLFLQPQSHERA